ncbi:hypothetical protein VDGD_20681 [Verticillium dahliae]|nr:hypothetical protein VDGD_20681 [Verticillium dahliae]
MEASVKAAPSAAPLALAFVAPRTPHYRQSDSTGPHLDPTVQAVHRNLHELAEPSFP